VAAIKELAEAVKVHEPDVPIYYALQAKLEGGEDEIIMVER